VIKTFRPLLRALNVQNIPNPPDLTTVYLADMRDLIVNGMGRCIVVVEQRSLADDVGGMLITFHDTELDYFRLHIVINSSLCNKIGLEDRVIQKITAVHEFTHTVAVLSAISRLKSKELIKRLKDIFKKKAHALYLIDLEYLANELKNPLAAGEDADLQKTTSAKRFPDEHFRLGFEDFPVSYPVAFDEFLFSKEMFEEYFPKMTINLLYKAFRRRDSTAIADLILPALERISQEKALYKNFIIVRIIKILFSSYIKIIITKKTRRPRK
jgi:hypothetical protein